MRKHTKEHKIKFKKQTVPMQISFIISLELMHSFGATATASIKIPHAGAVSHGPDNIIMAAMRSMQENPCKTWIMDNQMD